MVNGNQRVLFKQKDPFAADQNRKILQIFIGAVEDLSLVAVSFPIYQDESITIYNRTNGMFSFLLLSFSSYVRDDKIHYITCFFLGCLYKDRHLRNMTLVLQNEVEFSQKLATIETSLRK